MVRVERLRRARDEHLAGTDGAHAEEWLRDDERIAVPERTPAAAAGTGIVAHGRLIPTPTRTETRRHDEYP